MQPANDSRTIRKYVWRWLGWALCLAQVAGCVLLVAVQGWTGAPVLALFALLSAVGLRASPPVPAFYALLFAACCVANAAGWIWNLYSRIWWFDEALHFLTPLSIVAGLVLAGVRRGWLGRPKSLARSVVISVLVGLWLGLAWELAEAPFQDFALGDTVSDLVFDLLGSVAAGGVVWRALRSFAVSGAAEGAATANYGWLKRRRGERQM